MEGSSEVAGPGASGVVAGPPAPGDGAGSGVAAGGAATSGASEVTEDSLAANWGMDCGTTWNPGCGASCGPASATGSCAAVSEPTPAPAAMTTTAATTTAKGATNLNMDVSRKADASEILPVGGIRQPLHSSVSSRIECPKRPPASIAGSWRADAADSHHDEHVLTNVPHPHNPRSRWLQRLNSPTDVDISGWLNWSLAVGA